MALAIGVGAVALTGLFLTGNIRGATTTAFAEFENCGQGIRVGGDVKLRGVLVGEIGTIERADLGVCRIRLDLKPEDVDQIPENVGAQIRAKTIFGEKWVELLYPGDPSGARIAEGGEIPRDRTIDPIEVETILNVGLPLLDAIDPDHLAGALEALADGFVGHEAAAIRGIEDGLRALEPLNENKGLVREGIDQLAATGETFDEIDADLMRALANLDGFDVFTAENAGLIEASLDKTPRLLGELSSLFDDHLVNLTQIVNRGATVLGIVASRSDDLDALLEALPRFNSGWIRNLNHVCRFRTGTDEPGRSRGSEVPGRCWRVHNIISESRGAYRDDPDTRGDDARRDASPHDVPSLLRAPLGDDS